jgi:hypothetical protein
VLTRDNVYTVEAKTLDADAQHLLQVYASGDGGNDSYGRIVIRKR